MPADTSHLNLSVNPLCRQIDTMLEKYTVGEIKIDILIGKIVELADVLQKYPDLDIPNDVFVGVSNGTRRLIFYGFVMIAAHGVASISGIQEILKKIKPEQN